MSRVAALLLAAGQSRRMGEENKLLLPYHGDTVVGRAATCLLDSAAAPVIVVTGYQAGEILSALAQKQVQFVHNPDFAGGISTSLKAGLAALPGGVEAVLICLADMPDITPDLLNQMIAAYKAKPGKIIVPVRSGRRGNPVLWDKVFFPEMMALGGDQGARSLMGTHADDVVELSVGTDAIFRDIDTMEDYQRHGAQR
ncbi:nucleotidyltransferase family protein [Luteithermobacter gelatinilyticus]|uniref:nucleotidyltransferase family protein n=1 Tax=Luteithermobacter gelatinilyticus TaxID=2582913 RepID=UPI001105F690|nr:nucleotidyltransferase family protein [Luteithermobacter gelatinilyticus]